MKKRLPFFPALILGTLVLALQGCATSRSELHLASPAAAAAAPTDPNAPAVFIRAIKDERTFEQAPTDPSVPSLGFEGSEQAATETKARAIGRKRNTYGMALGDVLLQPGQTVESVVRDNMTASFREAGYHVRTEPGGGNVLAVDVVIKQFWSWIQPGFWAITVHGEIVTEVDLPGRTGVTTIRARTQDPRQLVTESAWTEAMQKTLEAYRREAVELLTGRKSGAEGAARPRPDAAPSSPAGTNAPLNIEDLSGLIDKR